MKKCNLARVFFFVAVIIPFIVPVISSAQTQKGYSIGTVTTAGGQVNYIPKWNSINTITNSQIFDQGTYIGLGNILTNTSLRIGIGSGETQPKERLQIGELLTFSDYGSKLYGYNHYFDVTAGVGKRIKANTYSSGLVFHGNGGLSLYTATTGAANSIIYWNRALNINSEGKVVFQSADFIYFNETVNIPGSLGIYSPTAPYIKKIILDPANNVAEFDLTIKAKEIYVQTDVWHDYVFNNDYELISLTELEEFINSNKHLPEIPTEKQILKDGINVGEMNGILLKKIEELTLYIIDLNEKYEKQQIELNNLKVSSN